MRARSVITVAFGLALAGCAKPLEVGSITEIKPPPGSQGIDVYAGRRIAGEKVPDFAGDQLVEVRTFADNANGGQEEIAGAACELKARDFSAQLTTPAKVRVPIYKSQSSPLSVKCAKDGYQPKLTDVGVYDETAAQRLNSGANAGVVGFLFMAAVNAATDAETHDYKYPQIRVYLEKPMTASAAKPAG